MNWSTAKKNENKAKNDIVEVHPQDDQIQESEGTTMATATAKSTTRGEDLDSGMEMLELDFLLGLIENTDSDETTDVTMRKLCFNELLRRNQQNEIDSYSLKIYAVNEKTLYTKHMQCEAMKELAMRTEQNVK